MVPTEKRMMESPDDLVRVLNLRLDEPLRRQLTAEARRSVRSLNGEIIFRLRRSLDQQSQDATS
jgi:predicted HicB family RNase H-like nuclease